MKSITLACLVAVVLLQATISNVSAAFLLSIGDYLMLSTESSGAGQRYIRYYLEGVIDTLHAARYAGAQVFCPPNQLLTADELRALIDRDIEEDKRVSSTADFATHLQVDDVGMAAVLAVRHRWPCDSSGNQK